MVQRLGVLFIAERKSKIYSFKFERNLCFFFFCQNQSRSQNLLTPTAYFSSTVKFGSKMFCNVSKNHELMFVIPMFF